MRVQGEGVGLTSDKRLHSKYTLHFPRTELSLLEPLAVWKPPAPKPPQERLGPRCKGKAGAELRPGRRQCISQPRAACSFLCRKPSSEASLGKPLPGQSNLEPGTLPDRASEQNWSSAVLEVHSAPAKQGFSRTQLGCLSFARGGLLPRMLFTRPPGWGALRLLQVLPQGLLPLSWGCGRKPRHEGAGPNQLHTSRLGRRALRNLPV